MWKRVNASLITISDDNLFLFYYYAGQARSFNAKKRFSQHLILASFDVNHMLLEPFLATRIYRIVLVAEEAKYSAKLELVHINLSPTVLVKIEGSMLKNELEGNCRYKGRSRIQDHGNLVLFAGNEVQARRTVIESNLVTRQ